MLTALGAWSVSLHSCWLAAVGLAVLGAAVEGPTAVARLTGTHLLAVVHLALVLTALAFVLWYSAVGRLGAARVGLFTGVAPVAAAGVGVLVEAGAPGAPVRVGIAVVVAGVALGLLRAAPARAVRARGGSPRQTARLPARSAAFSARSRSSSSKTGASCSRVNRGVMCCGQFQSKPRTATVMTRSTVAR